MALMLNLGTFICGYFSHNFIIMTMFQSISISTDLDYISTPVFVIILFNCQQIYLCLIPTGSSSTILF